MTPRRAEMRDIAALDALIRASARSLSRGHYSDAEIQAAIDHLFAVDTWLIADGTYLLVEDEGEPIGCGGWSRRGRDDGEALDPGHDAAQIRAFFVHPDHAHRGVGGALLKACEREAREAGYDALELFATLPGLTFYLRAGFTAEEPIDHDAGGTPVTFVPMRKSLRRPGRERAVDGRGDANRKNLEGAFVSGGAQQDVTQFDFQARDRPGHAGSLAG